MRREVWYDTLRTTTSSVIGVKADGVRKAERQKTERLREREGERDSARETQTTTDVTRHRHIEKQDEEGERARPLSGLGHIPTCQWGI
jgi:hypothetical protein